MDRITNKAAQVDPLNDGQLIDLYRRVYGYLLRLTAGDCAQAEELTQETLFRVIRSRDGLREPNRLIPWALRIATNVRLDHLRRHPIRNLKMEVEDSRPAPVLREEASNVLAHMASLSESFRSAVVLRYFGDLSYEEIAKILDAPLGTVKSNVARGLRQIRKLMEKHSNEMR